MAKRRTRNRQSRKRTSKREVPPRVLRTQREVLCDVLLSAGQCETWLTLHELALLTGYGEASVSAQLRHLRKPEYGGFTLSKRLRAHGSVIRPDFGPLWEYRLQRAWVIASAGKTRRRVAGATSPRPVRAARRAKTATR